MSLALLVPGEDDESIGHDLLVHKEDEQGMIAYLKEEKDDVHDQ